MAEKKLDEPILSELLDSLVRNDRQACDGLYIVFKASDRVFEINSRTS